MVEIAKAIHRSSSLLILDEPTTCLSLPERQRLFGVVHRLRASGYGILYITHFLEEVYELADRIVVLRDGFIAAQGAVSEITVEHLTRAMVGREQAEMLVGPAPLAADQPIILKVEKLSDRDLVRDVSFELRRGEILGLAGLMGAGRSEMAEILVGLRAGTGTIVLDGKPFHQRSPRSALEHGMVLVSEDRRKDQAFLGRSVKENITASSLPKLVGGALGWLNAERERLLGERIVREFAVQPPRLDIAMVSLSGGNQQKAIIGKWLGHGPKLCVLDEPTKGVDIGARAAVHQLIVDLASKGVAFILISSDLPEIVALAHRVIVLHKGHHAGTLERAQLEPSRIVHMASVGRDR